MRIQKIQKSDISFSESSTDLFCFGHIENTDFHENLSAASEHFSNNIQKAIELENFSGKLYKSVLVYGDISIKRIKVYGLGNKNESIKIILSALTNINTHETIKLKPKILDII